MFVISRRENEQKHREDAFLRRRSVLKANEQIKSTREERAAVSLRAFAPAAGNHALKYYIARAPYNRFPRIQLVAAY